MLIAVVLEGNQGTLDRQLSFEIAARLKAVDERIVEVLFRFDDTSLSQSKAM